MGQIISYIIFISILTNVSLATECPRSVQVIKQNEIANCNGFLFSDTAEKEAAQARDDVKFFKALIPSLEEKITLEETRNSILEKRLDLYIKQSDILAKQQIKNDNTSFIKNIGMFLLGGLVVYGAYNLVKN